MLSQEVIAQAIPQVIESVQLKNFGERMTGKVRDIYQRKGHRILITTDRISAFDRVLGHIPFKGQVLNQLSRWWFDQTQDLVANHMVAVPDENVMIAREANRVPVEVVVRGYITGVTSTALWTLYEAGDRKPYGVDLPDGLRKNDPLPNPIITPTTKSTDGGHDQRLTREEILRAGLVDKRLWERIEQVSLALFGRGQAVAERAGLILVDTKYEFGIIDGKLVLIDEVHTPDSSRYWVKETYRPGAGSPEHFDKEYIRLWYVDQGYRGEGEPPAMPGSLVAQMAERYIAAYERLTGQVFVPGEMPAEERIARNLAKWR